MAQNISVPDIGDFKDVEVIEVLVKPGDQIKKNDPLVTIESDKSSVEIPSPSEGQIKDLKVKVGDKVSEGSLLVTLESKDSTSVQVDKEEQKVQKEVKKIFINQNFIIFSGYLISINLPIAPKALGEILNKSKKYIPHNWE